MAENNDLAPPLATSSVLYAISKYIGIKCREQNMNYLKCKTNTRDPAKCLEQGAEVQSCVSNLLKSMNNACPEQLLSYSTCIENEPYELYMLEHCRKQEKALSKCAVPALDLESYVTERQQQEKEKAGMTMAAGSPSEQK
mmetsp:Transcript_9846/g.16928  ORF Transcript_9846/g.16928 Transcript_9846/m.16928 type:complete len:140 (-) Transcript_9846:90-509(-)|eukprot:CAMPEP_0184693036 /NCGR_PEP_ID=MMETSP0313-20130426/1346_1 /TAXON_ID=2792 /ORGANISM="Porphyridium aerugineum, Strain SAG 1380-2" /LENGTH=139 /DNA_ID=CAMNT_0027150991 /DNA_START=60 /DNA_END=479 /DNA_ORIENTATION=+